MKWTRDSHGLRSETFTHRGLLVHYHATDSPGFVSLAALACAPGTSGTGHCVVGAHHPTDGLGPGDYWALLDRIAEDERLADRAVDEAARCARVILDAVQPPPTPQETP